MKILRRQQDRTTQTGSKPPKLVQGREIAVSNMVVPPTGTEDATRGGQSGILATLTCHVLGRLQKTITERI